MSMFNPPPRRRNSLRGVVGSLRGWLVAHPDELTTPMLALFLRPALDDTLTKLRARGVAIPAAVTRPLELDAQVRDQLSIRGHAGTWLADQRDLDAITAEDIVDRIADTARQLALRAAETTHAQPWTPDDPWDPHVERQLRRSTLVAEEVHGELMQRALDGIGDNLRSLLNGLTPAWDAPAGVVGAAVREGIGVDSTAEHVLRGKQSAIAAWRALERTDALDELDTLWELRNTLIVLGGYHVEKHERARPGRGWLTRFAGGVVPLTPPVLVLGRAGSEDVNDRLGEERRIAGTRGSGAFTRPAGPRALPTGATTPALPAGIDENDPEADQLPPRFPPVHREASGRTYPARI